MQGRRVGVVDCDLQSPGIHAIFGVDQQTMGRSLDDYLWGECSIEDAAHDVTPAMDGAGDGRVWLVPASIKPAAIARLMHEGYDVGLLNEGCRELVKALSLDVLILDTHPGLNEETLLSIAMSNAVAIVMRPDRQDYEGTRVTVAVARKLKVPRMVLIVNKIPAAFDGAELRDSLATTYGCEVAAVLPHSEELMILSSAGIFVVRYPEHPLTRLFGEVAARLMA
jgi:MinD-like ATPase involved in chromosome partitioning or flagellar assembly